jgi:hypothetical protein
MEGDDLAKKRCRFKSKKGRRNIMKWVRIKKRKRNGMEKEEEEGEEDEEEQKDELSALVM